jgi:hypothetical protein
MRRPAGLVRNDLQDGVPDRWKCERSLFCAFSLSFRWIERLDDGMCALRCPVRGERADLSSVCWGGLWKGPLWRKSI